MYNNMYNKNYFQLYISITHLILTKSTIKYSKFREII